MERFNQIKYVNEYNKNNYDTIRFQVKKGQKEIIIKHYKKKGYTSMNAYINDLIKVDIMGGGAKMKTILKIQKYLFYIDKVPLRWYNKHIDKTSAGLPA